MTSYLYGLNKVTMKHMAHFYGTERVYRPRERVTPSEELAKMIFPWLDQFITDRRPDDLAGELS